MRFLRYIAIAVVCLLPLTFSSTHANRLEVLNSKLMLLGNGVPVMLPGGTAAGGGGGNGAYTNWYDNPGADACPQSGPTNSSCGFWKTPFYTTAQFATLSSCGNICNQVQSLIEPAGSPAGHIHIGSDYSVPFYVGKASDPICQVNAPTSSGTKTINVHIPAGSMIEAPLESAGSQFDMTIGGLDKTQPYLVWSVSGATINGGLGPVPSSGCVIQGGYGLNIDDGSGIEMEDAITHQQGTNNSFGEAISDADLTAANASNSYVIPHMLTYMLDQNQVSAAAPAWPLQIYDNSLGTNGPVVQGYTIGIPQSTPRPTGKSRAFYLLFDNLQQYGWFFYNVSGNAELSMDVYSTNSANASLLSQFTDSVLGDVLQYAGILTNQTGPTSIKGYASGGSLAYPPPPPLDLSPTSCKNVPPSNWGAWYSSQDNAINYSATAVETGGGGPKCNGGGSFTTSPDNTVVNGTAGSITDYSGRVWAINSSGQVTINGVADTSTSGAKELAWEGGAGTDVIWYENGSNLWFENPTGTAGAWTPTGGTSTSPVPGSSGGGGGASPNGTIITPGSGTINDGTNTWSIDASGNADENGNALAGGGGTAEAEWCNSVVYWESTGSPAAWYTWNGSTFVAAGAPTCGGGGGGGGGGGTPTGQFTVKNGLIYAPTGLRFVARGINITDDFQSTVSTNSSAQPLTTLFPGINFVRVAVESGFPAASNFTTFVNQLTANHIVVELEYHPWPLVNATGGAGSAEANWYTAIATAFKGNPYVWFGTMNEPQGGNITAEEVADYNAVRNAGATNMMMLSSGVGSGNPGQTGTAVLTASSYSSMTNVAWDIHLYGWITSNTSQSVWDSIVSGTYESGTGIASLSPITDTDGAIPFIYGEFGQATGSSVDAAAPEVEHAAAITSIADGGSGYSAWNWDAGDPNVEVSNGALTAYGQTIANFIANTAKQFPDTPTRVPAPLTGSVTTGTWTAVDYAPPALNGQAAVVLPSGKKFHFEYLLPSGYSTSYVYPVIVWEHSDCMGDPWYLGNNTNPTQLDSESESGTNATPNFLYNNVTFRTNYPAIILLPYADQTMNGQDCPNDALENWGGWVNNGTTGSSTSFSGDTGPNTFAVVAMVQSWLPANLSADMSKIYCAGFSLGAIGCHYDMLKYNQVNGSPKLFTAGMDIAGVLEINGDGSGPTSANETTLTSVPEWWISGGQDGTSIPSHWNEPLWQHYAGNSSYPAPGSSATASTAGSSLYHYWQDPNIGHQMEDSSGNEYMANTTILNWLYSQIGSNAP